MIFIEGKRFEGVYAAKNISVVNIGPFISSLSILLRFILWSVIILQSKWALIKKNVISLSAKTLF